LDRRKCFSEIDDDLFVVGDPLTVPWLGLPGFHILDDVTEQLNLTLKVYTVTG